MMSALMTCSLATLVSAFCILTQACAASTGGPSNPAELEAFVDQLFARHMAKSHTPGAVFVLVSNGHILFMKGYGVARVEERTPVVPDRTLFRIASISKLFTATAIMQPCCLWIRRSSASVVKLESASPRRTSSIHLSYAL